MILLADDSAHAQRMGERILREEGYEVASATDGNMALAFIAHSDPDLVIADAFLPGRNGLDLCRLVKSYRPHIRVVLTAGLLENLDEEEARAAGCDAVLRKPFEASVTATVVRPLVEEAQRDRGRDTPAPVEARPVSDAPGTVPVDPDRVEAAVAAVLEDLTPVLIRDITRRVLIALNSPPSKNRSNGQQEDPADSPGEPSARAAAPSPEV